MSETKRVAMWIEWSDEDSAFLGYCPQFFPYGAVCHGHTEGKTLFKLATLVRQELEERRELPKGLTRRHRNSLAGKR
jgi:hypothetical protein